MIRTQPRIAGMILCAALFLGLSQQTGAEMVPQWELGAGVAGLMLPDFALPVAIYAPLGKGRSK